MIPKVHSRQAWARGLGISLVPTDASTVLQARPLADALAEGIAHGYEGPLHAFPTTAEWYAVREQGADVGVAVVQRDVPEAGQAALYAVAIAAEHRGRATATKAVLLVERRLKRDGVARLVARVPRTNGRGLYFMLRVGYTPLPADDARALTDREGDDVTWFARGGRG